MIVEGKTSGPPSRRFGMAFLVCKYMREVSDDRVFPIETLIVMFKEERF